MSSTAKEGFVHSEYLIETEELAARLGDPSLVVLDSTTHLIPDPKITYTVKPLPEQSKLQVTVSFPAKPGAVEIQMPNWAPGSYRLSYPWRNVQDLAMKGAAGAALTVEKPNDYTWKTVVNEPGVVTATYTMNSALTMGVMHYSGPSTYVYVVGRK